MRQADRAIGRPTEQSDSPAYRAGYFLCGAVLLEYAVGPFMAEKGLNAWIFRFLR